MSTFNATTDINLTWGAKATICLQTLRVIALCALISLIPGMALAAKAGGGSKLPYAYFAVGAPGALTDTTPKITSPRLPSYLLMGGGPDVDEGFRAMIRKAGVSAAPNAATGGRFVVIRASGTDAYNSYIFDASGSQWPGYVGGQQLGLSSVETLVIPSRTAADHPDVFNIIQRADVLFIAGGDQAQYINFWKGTGVDRAIGALVQRNVPIGGTSAGLAVLGQIDFAALNGTVQSTQALSDPYNRYMTFDPNPMGSTGGFIAPPALKNLIFDSHVDERDRLGRLMTFVARMIKREGNLGCDGGAFGTGAGGARGIGLGVETALLVEQDANTQQWVARRITNDAGNTNPGNVTTTPSAVYFVRPQGAVNTCTAKRPLSMSLVEVYRLDNSTDTFNLSNWLINGTGSLPVADGTVRNTFTGQVGNGGFELRNSQNAPFAY